MANAAPADASSSANVNPTIIATEYPSPDTIKIVLCGGISIVSRLCYFNRPLAIEHLPISLTEAQSEILYQAGRCFLAEKQALAYLNRAEYSLYQLTVKLQKKGYLAHEYQPALDYLLQRGIVDDTRFAAAWLYTRSLSKKEGRSRLFSELRKRGISAAIAQKALANFLSDNTETALCEKAMQLFIRKGYDEPKLFRALLRKGFPFSMIKKCITQLSSNTL